MIAKLMIIVIESDAYQVGEECKLNCEVLFKRILS